MDSSSQEAGKSRERTLLAAVLLSAWAPLSTGIAVYFSRSTTQLADFARRTAELMALLVSWLVYRHISRRQPSREVRARLERMANISVAVTLTISGLVMLGLALSRISEFQPGGNVYPGLAIAALGLGVNGWFWQRYRRLNREAPNAIIAGQSRLYRAKCLVDLCVLVALIAIAIAPGHILTRYVDILGTGAVAVYLLVSGAKTRGLSGRRDAGKVRAGGEEASPDRR
jgi:divalent metal cation (Fe/Co/Zn/Cd) transporter